jgi:hypothetical protein
MVADLLHNKDKGKNRKYKHSSFASPIPEVSLIIPNGHFIHYNFANQRPEIVSKTKF